MAANSGLTAMVRRGISNILAKLFHKCPSPHGAALLFEQCNISKMAISRLGAAFVLGLQREMVTQLVVEILFEFDPDEARKRNLRISSRMAVSGGLDDAHGMAAITSSNSLISRESCFLPFRCQVM